MSGSSNIPNENDGLCALAVGDSTFIGFATRIKSESDARDFRDQLRQRYPDAAHAPLCWCFASNGSGGGASSTPTEASPVDSSGFDEDGEPPDSSGPPMSEELKTSARSAADVPSPAGGVALVVVRFFGRKLLGVTCGRLSQCYRRAARLTMHRFFHPGAPLEDNFVRSTFNGKAESLYGLAAGDTELILNAVPDKHGKLMQKVRDELEFGGFRGAKDEVLPRLQNLQADVSTKFIPVYRYPGNYQVIDYVELKHQME
mmetsp:Transcript_58093/g.173375  ORF Transcript_58093/g.173375 Transcript_58093/m.173375 type:complete len:258 (-) Transcript_58093:965-1738(-)